MNYVQRICKRAQKGDERSAHELLSLFYEEIFSYLRRLCGDVQDAEDLTQETFVKVWLSLSGYQGQCKFLTWVYKIAYNNYIDWHRKKSARYCNRPWWEEYVVQKVNSFDNTLEKEMSEHVYKLVDQIDEDKRQVVHLHYYQGVSLKETAKVLNIATSTVKYRLREAIEILRSKICIED